MTTLRASIRTKLTASYSGSSDVGAIALGANDENTITFSDGTGASQAQKYVAKSYTISASGSTNVDLAGGLTDAFGTTITLTKVKAVRLRAATGNTNNVVVGGAASNTWVGPFGDATDTIAIKPGGELLLVDPSAAGYTVTAATGDILKLANSSSGTAVTVILEVVGV